MILIRLRVKKMDAGLYSLRSICSDLGSLRCMERGGRGWWLVVREIDL
jgi:hypothetical protein